jgi:hypothetical protein
MMTSGLDREWFTPPKIDCVRKFSDASSPMYAGCETGQPVLDVKPARQPRRGRAPEAPRVSCSRHGIDPDLIAAGRLPDKAPEVTSGLSFSAR